MKKAWYISQKIWDKEEEHVTERLKYANGEQSEVFSYLYDRLSILDGKVSALLTVNSILLAAAGLAAPLVRVVPAEKPIFVFAALIWLLSTILCLGISFVKWEHLCKDADVDAYQGQIIRVTLFRTFFYNLAVALILALLIYIAFWGYRELPQ